MTLKGAHERGRRDALEKFGGPLGAMMPGPLKLMGLGALGAGLMGLHKEHQQDVAGRNLVYAPMQGTPLQ